MKQAVYTLVLAATSLGVAACEALALFTVPGSVSAVSLVAFLGAAVLGCFLAFDFVLELGDRSKQAKQVSRIFSEVLAFMIQWSMYFAFMAILCSIVLLVVVPAISLVKFGHLPSSEVLALGIRGFRAAVVSSLALAVVMYTATKFGWLNREA